MPKEQRKALNRLISLTCAEISQEMMRELYFTKKRKWVRDWIAKRDIFGASNTLLKELAAEDSKEYRNVLRMDSAKYEALLAMITTKITKQDTTMRIL